jgi:5-methyltetrahydrofolate--homocysteine methyltransferase
MEWEKAQMELLNQISDSLQRGDDDRTAELTKQAMDQQVPPREILDNGLIAGMTIVGNKFKAHDIFLPDVLLAARAMYAGMELLKPLMIKEEIPTRGRVILGTVQGDLHDIGKNLVGIMLKGAGFDVIDLGNDVAAERFVEAAINEKAPIIGLSALLTTTMPVMKQVVDLVKQRGLSEKIRVVIGGAPVTEQYARDIGADAYGFDGVNAVDCVNNIMPGG